MGDLFVRGFDFACVDALLDGADGTVILEDWDDDDGDDDVWCFFECLTPLTGDCLPWKSWRSLTSL